MLEAKTELQIGAPVHDVFEAIADPKKMSAYFITTGSGRLQEGKIITWTWADYNAVHEIHVEQVEKDRLISFLWSASGVETKVKITLEPSNENVTLVKIRERGWDKDDEGIARLADQTQGWVNMIFCLKGYLEYGINLRSIANRNEMNSEL